METSINPMVLAFISASGGALVSSCITLLGQTLDRRSRKQEIVFNASIEHAKRWMNMRMEIAKHNRDDEAFRETDEALTAGRYYTWFEYLFEHGHLPKEAIDAEQSMEQEMEALRQAKASSAQKHNERLVRDAVKHPLKAKHLIANTQDLSVFTEEQYKRLEKAAGQSYP